MKRKKSLRKMEMKLPKHLEHINRYAAGIEIGSKSHFVAVPEGTDEQPVREFSTFTADLERLAEWLIACGVTTVAMESTGVYWIPVFEILESHGLDCRWLSATPYLWTPSRRFPSRRRGMYPSRLCTSKRHAGAQHLTFRGCSKALAQMNLQLHNVVTDITGATGMRIIKAILHGERNPDVPADMRDPRCKNSSAMIARSLKGNYRSGHLFSLQQAVELYEVYQTKIADCDRQILKQLESFDDSPDNIPPASLEDALVRMSWVDLTSIDGIDTTTALKILSGIGTDMSCFKSARHFASWPGLSPGTKVSGGKVSNSATKQVANKAAAALRMAAFTLFNSRSAPGAYPRRQRARSGAPKAITATAHKLARLVYAMLTHGTAYVDAGQEYYEERYRSRVIQNLKRKAQEPGFELITIQKAAVV